MAFGDRRLAGAASGGPFVLRVSGRMLRRVADAALGREISCEFAGPEEPVEWRTPAQPDFAAVMMPQPG